MRDNIPKLYVSNFLTGLVFWYAIEKLFMGSIGIDAFGISINAVILVVITTSFDIPFGVLADRWNRKYTLVLGMLALAIGSFIAGISDSLPLYTAGTVFYGLYLCMTNGTFQAITYDSLQEENRIGSYAKHQGGSYALFMVGIAVSSPIGGFLSEAYGYRSSYYVSVAVCALNILVILSMREPKFHKLSEQTKLLQHVGSAFSTLRSSKALLYMASILVVVGMLRSSLNEYAGLYFIAIGFGAIGSGWANGGKWLFGALGQFISARLGRYVPVLLIAFFAAFLVMSTWRTPLGLLFFYICTFTHGVIQNEVQADMQDHIASSLRATVLSIINFGTNGLMIPLGLAFGWLALHKSVFAAYSMFAYIGLAYALVWFVWRRKVSVPLTKATSSNGGGL